MADTAGEVVWEDTDLEGKWGKAGRKEARTEEAAMGSVFEQWLTKITD